MDIIWINNHVYNVIENVQLVHHQQFVNHVYKMEHSINLEQLVILVWHIVVNVIILDVKNV
jgi:exosome complex RNA-binding protein Rrp42 (RNase PH superfamily)